jgi:hypothetical protein
MDYRYYRGEGIELPPAIVKRLHWLRYIGALMIASPVIFAFLMMFDCIKLSFFWFFASFLLGSFGNVFFIIGISYDTIMDRDAKPGQWVRVRLFGKHKESKEFKPGRKMIYDLDEEIDYKTDHETKEI